MVPGPIFQPTSRVMIKAPKGMATPSEMKSIKSSQEAARFRPVWWKGTHSPLDPRPSTATRVLTAMTARQTRPTMRLRLGLWPFRAAWSRKKVTMTSVRAMAEVMAARETSR